MTPKSMSQITISAEDIQHFEPFAELSLNQLESLRAVSEVKRLSPKEVLFNAGDKDLVEYFLFKGELNLRSGDGIKRVIHSDDPQAKKQIAKLRPRQYTATASVETVVLAIKATDGCFADSQIPMPEVSSYEVTEVDEDWQEQVKADLMTELQLALDRDRLKLPSLPQVAVRIGELVESEEASADDVARLVNTDPAFAAKLLRVANSALYSSLGKCDGTREAIVRLGLGATRQLIMGFAVRDLFQSPNQAMRIMLRSAWVESLEVAALAIVIQGKLKSKNYSAEETLLAGLLHNIGFIGLLGFLSDKPTLLDEENLDLSTCVEQYRAQVGVKILTQWGFPAVFVDVVKHAENWTYKANNCELCDLIQVAKLHRSLANRKPLPMASIGASEAVGRLNFKDEFSDKLSASILQDAKQKILEVKQLFD